MAEREDRATEELIGLHNLKPAPGSRRPRKRVGRGEGSGTGKTAGRGQKGYGSRSGSKRRARFEGGQNPIHMRMRKLRGPNKKMSMPFEPFRTHTQPVNLADLERGSTTARRSTSTRCSAAGLGTRKDIPVKILGARRADQEAHRPRPRVLQDRPRADRGRRRDLPGHRVGQRAVMSTILNAFRVADIRKKLRSRR